MNNSSNHLDRYHRQMLLPGIGADGQEKLLASHALIVGCGALGCAIADTLTRAGVGTLTIVDRDLVELTNLQRQVLFTESDAQQGLPKALAAKTRLQSINSTIKINAHVDDFNHRNAERYAAGADIILDGLDNFETRYLLNDLAVSLGLPYIYGGAVSTTGMTLPILPVSTHRKAKASPRILWSDDQATPCLRCVFPDPPPPGSSPTCDTAGVLGPVVNLIAAHQATSALKLLSGNIEALDRRMLSIDLWTNELRQFDISGAREAEQCPCCGQGKFEHLQGRTGSATISLCGRNAVQITPPGDGSASLDLGEFARRLTAHGNFIANEYLLRGILEGENGPEGEAIELTLFANGRAIIKGLSEPEAARTIYAKYVGA